MFCKVEAETDTKYWVSTVSTPSYKLSNSSFNILTKLELTKQNFNEMLDHVTVLWVYNEILPEGSGNISLYTPNRVTIQSFSIT